MSIVVEEMWIDNSIQRTLYKADEFALPDAPKNINEDILALVDVIPFEYIEGSITYNQAPQWVAESDVNVAAGYNYHSMSAYMSSHIVPLINSIDQADFNLNCTVTQWLPVHARKYNLDDSTMSFKAMGKIDSIPLTMPVTLDLDTTYIAVGYSDTGVASSSYYDLYFKATDTEMATIASYFGLAVPKVGVTVEANDYFGLTIDNSTNLPNRFKYYNFK